MMIAVETTMKQVLISAILEIIRIKRQIFLSRLNVAEIESAENFSDPIMNEDEKTDHRGYFENQILLTSGGRWWDVDTRNVVEKLVEKNSRDK